jgi:hypothetical protein
LSRLTGEADHRPPSGTNSSARRLGFAGALAAIVTVTASSPPARADVDEMMCNGVGFELQRPLAVAKVVGSSRIYFVKGAGENASCPSEAASCREPSYLVPGDLVLSGRTEANFVCAAYQSPSAHEQDWTKGWLPASALLAVAATSAPTLSDWIGDWTHPGGEITISRGDGRRLKITGLQTYQATLNVHTGDIAAEVEPANGVIAFADDGGTAFDKADKGQCIVRMQRVGAFLAVEDNQNCGGVMVTFTGLYRRK